MKTLAEAQRAFRQAREAHALATERAQRTLSRLIEAEADLDRAEDAAERVHRALVSVFSK